MEVKRTPVQIAAAPQICINPICSPKRKCPEIIPTRGMILRKTGAIPGPTRYIARFQLIIVKSPLPKTIYNRENMAFVLNKQTES